MAINPIRKERLAELRKRLPLTAVGGDRPPRQVINETITLYLNSQNGRRVVAPKGRRGWRT